MALRKSDLDGLKLLQQKVEGFSDEIFDWVSILCGQDFLKEVYNFEDKIDSAIKSVEGM